MELEISCKILILPILSFERARFLQLKLYITAFVTHYVARFVRHTIITETSNAKEYLEGN